MYSAKQVDTMVAEWKAQGLSKVEIVVKTGEAEVGWPYVWGAVGALCTPVNRRYYAQRDTCPPDESKVILSKCQVCRPNDPMRDCMGCKYYPDEKKTLADDCQGFVKQVCSRVGISFNGGGCTSMWKDNSNWSAKGDISTLPEKVCCVFWTDQDDKSKKSHIGFYIGNGMMIHCSGEVKKEKLSKKCTDWAMPKGLDGETPVWRTTIRKGSTGEDVVYCQQLLIKLGYDLAPYGADGKFGNKTRNAVVSFQRTHGLNADGVVGPLTWDALEKAAGGDPGTGLYTVTIKHVDLTQAKALVAAYPNAEMEEEKESE